MTPKIALILPEIRRSGPRKRSEAGRKGRREPALLVRTDAGEERHLIRALPEGKECRILRSVTVVKRSEIVRSAISGNEVERFEVRCTGGALCSKRAGSLRPEHGAVVRFHRTLTPRSGWRINFGELPAQYRHEQRLASPAPGGVRRAFSRSGGRAPRELFRRLA